MTPYRKKQIIESLEFAEAMGVDSFIGDTPINRLDPIFQKQEGMYFKEVVDILKTSSQNASLKKPKEKEPIIMEKSPASTSSLIKAFPQIAPDQTRIETEQKIRDVHSLEDLKKAMEAFEGCPLKTLAQNLVFGEGVAHAPVMVIGEAPGADEDRQGRPFVGMSGQLLDKVLKAVGMSRLTNVYITNVIPYRPPGNRQPTPAEIALYMPFLERHIELTSPKFLLLLGGTAVKALLNTQEGIIRLRGRWQSYKHATLQTPIPALATYHPAYLLRSPSKKREVWYDVLTLKQAIEQGGSS